MTLAQVQNRIAEIHRILEASEEDGWSASPELDGLRDELWLLEEDEYDLSTQPPCA